MQGPLHGEDDASAVVSEAMREMVSRVALRHRRNQFISSADGSPVHHREDADAAGPMARGNANGTLPAHLERFIADEMLHGVKGKRVRQAVSAMRSQVSKAAGGLSASSSGRRAVHPRGQLEADAYVAGNLAGHYAIMSRIASEIRMRFPNFLPNRVMELCHSNTAVGTLACIPILQGGGADVGGTSIRRGRHADVTAVCESTTMRSSAMALLRAAGVAPDSGDLSLRTNVTWFRRMPSAARRRDRFDLVISAFSLSSLGGGGEDDEDAHVSDAHMQGDRDGVVSYTWSREQRQHLTDLWDHVAEDGMLILVENGNSDGCALMNSARGFLIESSRLRRAEAATPPSLHIVGPCPHENACPMSSLKRARCFFRQRFEPPGYRRALLGPKGKGFEEMSYSYLVLRKGARGSATTLADHGFDADELFSPRATTDSLESDGGVDAPDDLDGGYSSQALGMHGDIGDDVTHQLRSIVTDSANRDWSRIVKTPSREKKGFTRLELVRFVHATILNVDGDVAVGSCRLFRLSARIVVHVIR